MPKRVSEEKYIEKINTYTAMARRLLAADMRRRTRERFKKGSRKLEALQQEYYDQNPGVPPYPFRVVKVSQAPGNKLVLFDMLKPFVMHEWSARIRAGEEISTSQLTLWINALDWSSDYPHTVQEESELNPNKYDVVIYFKITNIYHPEQINRQGTLVEAPDWQVVATERVITTLDSIRKQPTSPLSLLPESVMACELIPYVQVKRPIDDPFLVRQLSQHILYAAAHTHPKVSKKAEEPFMHDGEKQAVLSLFNKAQQKKRRSFSYHEQKQLVTLLHESMQESSAVVRKHALRPRLHLSISRFSHTFSLFFKSLPENAPSKQLGKGNVKLKK